MFWNKNKSGLSKEKKNILKKVSGAASSNTISLNKINDEWENKSEYVCDSNNNLPECDIISKIKEYQNELDKLNIDQNKIKSYTEYRSLYIEIYCIIGHIFNCENEESLVQFLKDLNDYANIQFKIKKLSKKICEEKNKLGIK